MNEREQIKSALSGLRASEDTIQEVLRMTRKTETRRKPVVWRAVLVAAMLVCSFALGAFAFAQEPQIVEKEVFIEKPQEKIELPEIGLALLLPDDWAGKYDVEYFDGGKECAVYVKSVYEDAGSAFAGQGCLFRVGWIDRPMTPEELRAASPEPCRYLFATANATCRLIYASDIQYDWRDPVQTEAYQSMDAQIGEIRFLLPSLLD